MILSAYKYFYYRNLVFYQKTWPDDMPQYNALLVVSFLLFLNLFTIAGMIDILVGKGLLAGRVGNFMWVGLLAGVFLLSHALLVRDRRYESIVSEFQTETQNQKDKRSKLILFYVLTSFAMFFGLVAIRNS